MEYNLLMNMLLNLLLILISGPVLAADNAAFEIPSDSKSKAHFPQELAHVGGHVCFSCYDENRQKARKLLEQFKAVEQAYQSGQANSKQLPDYPHDSQFKVSGSGVLIHKECFDPKRFTRGFNVEEAIVNSFAEAFANLLEGEERATTYGYPENAIIKSHIPRLLHLFDRQVWSQNNDHIDVYDYGTDQVYENLQDPCRQLNLGDIQNCKFNPRVERYRPKLFCNRDEFSKQRQDFEANKGTASASMLGSPSMISKNYNGETNLYAGNFIMFNEGATRNISELGFKATAMHEFFHNLGYGDGGESISYGYGCLPYMFQNSAGIDRDNIEDNDTRIDSLKSCITTDPNSIYAEGATSGSKFIKKYDGL
ncbi:MAG: hypothetical protein R3E90_07825 [Marinicella sp.]